MYSFSLAVNSIALVKPEKAAQIEDMLLQMAQSGQISQKVLTFVVVVVVIVVVVVVVVVVVFLSVV